MAKSFNTAAQASHRQRSAQAHGRQKRSAYFPGSVYKVVTAFAAMDQVLDPLELIEVQAHMSW